MPIAKRKISLSLDDDLIATLEGTQLNLSAQVNAALRRGLDRLDAELGPVDEEVIVKFEALLA
jgi:post-segregation antitoxin (ccd killing protein)